MGVYARRNFVIANFGPNVLLTQPLTNGQVLVYNAQLGSFVNQPGSELFTASNLGTGVPVFGEKQGSDFEFNTLTAGAGIDITKDSQGNITISGNTSGAAAVLMVGTIAERNALTGLSNGTLVFVQNTGTGSSSYALYMWNSNTSTWTLIGTEESAEGDANTFTYTLNPSSPTKIPLGYISAGHRAVEITVNTLLAFNGSSPTLTIGDDTNGPSSLMASNLNDLENAGDYDSEGSFVYPGPNDTLINAYFNSGSSTIGQAIIIVSYV